MKPNEAIEHLKIFMELYYDGTPKHEALTMAIKALESVSKTDNGEVKSAEEFLKEISPDDKFGIRADLIEHKLYRIVCDLITRYHNQFPSVKVSDEEIEKVSIEQANYVNYNVGFYDGAVWMRSRMSNNKTE